MDSHIELTNDPRVSGAILEKATSCRAWRGGWWLSLLLHHGVNFVHEFLPCIVYVIYDFMHFVQLQASFLAFIREASKKEVVAKYGFDTGSERLCRQDTEVCHPRQS